jgi:hypothetical protein
VSGSLVIAGAVAGLALLALAALAWRFVAGGRRRGMLRTPEEAVEAAAAALPDLAALDAVVGDDGRAGLVLGTDGRVVVVTAAGRAGAVPWAALRQTGEGVVVETGSRRLGEVLLKGVDALDVRRLGTPLAG